MFTYFLNVSKFVKFNGTEGVRENILIFCVFTFAGSGLSEDIDTRGTYHSKGKCNEYLHNKASIRLTGD